MKLFVVCTGTYFYWSYTIMQHISSNISAYLTFIAEQLKMLLPLFFVVWMFAFFSSASMVNIALLGIF